MEKTYSMRPDKSTGDKAVDGLLAGLGASIVMSLFLLTTGLMNNDSLAVVFGRFDPALGNNMVTGLLTHLAISAIYGVIFSLVFMVLIRIRPSLMQLGWLTGLIYGLVLYGIARTAFLTGINSGLVQFPAVHLPISHAIYGLVLGFILGRQQ